MKIVSKRSRKTLRKSKRKTRRKTLRKSKRRKGGGIFSRGRSKKFCKNYSFDCANALGKNQDGAMITIQCKNKHKTNVTKSGNWINKIDYAWLVGEGKCNCSLNPCNNQVLAK